MMLFNIILMTLLLISTTTTTTAAAAIISLEEEPNLKQQQQRQQEQRSLLFLSNKDQHSNIFQSLPSEQGTNEGERVVPSQNNRMDDNNKMAGSNDNLILLDSLSSTSSSASAYIVGGYRVPTLPNFIYPYFATPYGNLTCGATLIHPDILLTAGHCLGLFLDGVVIGTSIRPNGFFGAARRSSHENQRNKKNRRKLQSVDVGTSTTTNVPSISVAATPGPTPQPVLSIPVTTAPSKNTIAPTSRSPMTITPSISPVLTIAGTTTTNLPTLVPSISIPETIRRQNVFPTLAPITNPIDDPTIVQPPFRLPLLPVASPPTTTTTRPLPAVSPSSPNTIPQDNNSNINGQVRLVVQQYRHPDYFTDNADIMLLKLNESVYNITPANYETNPNFPNTGTNLITMGFGITETGFVSNTLLAVNLTTRDTNQCNIQYTGYGGVDGTIYFCASADVAGRDSCSGDSGGPIIDAQTGIVQGIVSWGNACGDPDFPGVYTRLGAFQEWIRDGICQLSSVPPSDCPNGSKGRRQGMIRTRIVVCNDQNPYDNRWAIYTGPSRSTTSTRTLVYAQTIWGLPNQCTMEPIRLSPGVYTFKVWDERGNGIALGNNNNGPYAYIVSWQPRNAAIRTPQTVIQMDGSFTFTRNMTFTIPNLRSRCAQSCALRKQHQQQQQQQPPPNRVGLATHRYGSGGACIPRCIAPNANLTTVLLSGFICGTCEPK